MVPQQLCDCVNYFKDHLHLFCISFYIDVCIQHIWNCCNTEESFGILFNLKIDATLQNKTKIKSAKKANVGQNVLIG